MAPGRRPQGGAVSALQIPHDPLDERLLDVGQLRDLPDVPVLLPPLFYGGDLGFRGGRLHFCHRPSLLVCAVAGAGLGDQKRNAIPLGLVKRTRDVFRYSRDLVRDSSKRVPAFRGLDGIQIALVDPTVVSLEEYPASRVLLADCHGRFSRSGCQILNNVARGAPCCATQLNHTLSDLCSAESVKQTDDPLAGGVWKDYRRFVKIGNYRKICVLLYFQTVKFADLAET
jgi:hypothetical protein